MAGGTNTTSSSAYQLLRQQVIEHGELLAELGAIVKELHENAKTDRALLGQVSEAVIVLKERDAMRGRLVMYVLPVVTALIGGLAGHFLH